jgi:hypothetical protein
MLLRFHSYKQTRGACSDLLILQKTISNKKQACKPGSVEFYHLSRSCIAAKLKQPTLRIERAALTLRFIWSFNSQGLPEIIVANYFRELLPHVFTITSYYYEAVFLCGTCCLHIAMNPSC